jgi:hypothetical protein
MKTLVTKLHKNIYHTRTVTVLEVAIEGLVNFIF